MLVIGGVCIVHCVKYSVKSEQQFHRGAGWHGGILVCMLPCNPRLWYGFDRVQVILFFRLYLILVKY